MNTCITYNSSIFWLTGLLLMTSLVLVSCGGDEDGDGDGDSDIIVPIEIRAELERKRDFYLVPLAKVGFRICL